MSRAIKLTFVLALVIILSFSALAAVDSNETQVSIQDDEAASEDTNLNETSDLEEINLDDSDETADPNETDNEPFEIEIFLVDNEEEESDEPRVVDYDVNACAYYFYGRDCKSCQNLETHLTSVEELYPNLQLQRYEVYFNQTNLALLDQFYTSYGVEDGSQSVPVMFIAQTYFIGEQAIKDYFEEQLTADAESCPDSTNTNAVGIVSNNEPKDLIKTLGVFSLAGSAFKNLASASGLAVILVFLLINLVVMKRSKTNNPEELMQKNEELMRTSMVYIITYFLAITVYGIAWVGNFKFGMKAFPIVLAAISIIAAVWITKKYLFEGELIPRKYFKKTQEFTKKVYGIVFSNFGVFLLAVITAFFTIVGLSGQYLALYYLASETVHKWSALPLLVWHNLIFVLVMLLFAFFLHWRIKVYRQIANDKVRMYKINMLVMLIVLLLLVLGVLVFVL
ncbi:MAG: hypothetical protein ABIG93_04590 [archaeon]|nr:hypothetical protein [Nanoarchaeota archaeon]